jgi:peptidoglycan/xylan/chitin deacetylase (PgdA/CDA1 family)
MVVWSLRSRRRWLPLLAALAVLVLARWVHAWTARDVLPASPASGRVSEPLRSVATKSPDVALTFDVEWGERQPRAVLDVLRARHVHATFFLAAPWARAHADLVRAMLADGDEVGSLGNRSVPLSRYPETVVREELARAGEDLAIVTGRQPAYFRPPQGDVDPAVLRAVSAAGYTAVLWSVDALDALKPGVDYIVDRVVRRAEPGAIIRLHADDGAPQTAAALPGILAGLQRRGLRCVTVGQLVALAGRSAAGAASGGNAGAPGAPGARPSVGTPAVSAPSPGTPPPSAGPAAGVSST